MTSLADGADQLFAHAVLDQRGLIEVIVPAAQYRDGLPAESHPEYDDLLDHASKVHRLNFTESTSESHMAASELMISMISELFAVWDQQPARGYGGTADVVAQAPNKGGPYGSSGLLARPATKASDRAAAARAAARHTARASLDGEKCPKCSDFRQLLRLHSGRGDVQGAAR